MYVLNFLIIEVGIDHQPSADVLDLMYQIIYYSVILIFFTGPGYPGRRGTFEDRIFYGNHVLLNQDWWDHLKSIVKQCEPPIPYYVSTVTRSAVIRGKSKMVNTWSFFGK